MYCPEVFTTSSTIWVRCSSDRDSSDFRDAVKLAASALNNRVPSIARPKVAPTCRNVEVMELALPVFAGGTSSITTLVNCAVSKPTPMPCCPQPR